MEGSHAWEGWCVVGVAMQVLVDRVGMVRWCLVFDGEQIWEVKALLRAGWLKVFTGGELDGVCVWESLLCRVAA